MSKLGEFSINLEIRKNEFDSSKSQVKGLSYKKKMENEETDHSK